MIVSGVVKMAMQHNKKNSVGELVDSWNRVSPTITGIWVLQLIVDLQDYFHPRRLEVILAKGRDRLDSGHGFVPDIDPQIERMAPSLARTSSGSSSSSSGRFDSRSDRRQMKRDRKQKKREARRQGMGIDRGGDASRYRLFIVGL